MKYLPFEVFSFCNGVSCNPGWSGMPDVIQDVLNFCPHLLSWGYRSHHHAQFLVMGIQHRASCILGEHSTDWAPSPASLSSVK